MFFYSQNVGENEKLPSGVGPISLAITNTNKYCYTYYGSVYNVMILMIHWGQTILSNREPAIQQNTGEGFSPRRDFPGAIQLESSLQWLSPCPPQLHN